MELAIEGLGCSGPRTTHFGTFACTVQAREGPGLPHKLINYTGISFTVRDAQVLLWSEVQLSAEGHRIFRDGHPDS